MLRAYIGPAPKFTEILETRGVRKFHRLRQDVILVSRSAVRAALNLGEPAPCCRPAEGLSLDSDEIEWARATSNECALGFIQTEYFAGIGDQAGIVWDAGTVVLGPLYGTNDEHDPPEGDVVLTSAPINEILRWLGAKGTGSVDEFDALGLGEFRSMT